MEEREKRYCIIKVLKLPNGKDVNVIMLDGTSEVLEYASKGDANSLADLLESNSDSGWKYVVKEI